MNPFYVAARNGGLPKRYAQAKSHFVVRFAAPLMTQNRDAVIPETMKCYVSNRLIPQ
jgi:hypothetical protein